MNIRNIFSGFLVLILTACSTFSAAGFGQDHPVSFPAITAVETAWHPLANGIEYFHGKIDSPILEFWALRIDLLSPNIEIVTTSGAINSGSVNSENNQSLSTRVSSFVNDNNLIAGINAVPFDVSSTRERQPIQNMGIVISNGTQLSPINSRYDALVIYNNRRAAIVNQSSIRSTENIKNAVGGFHQILINGAPALRTQNSETRHPRSAAGVSANGRFLYLLVIDGRRAASIGGTEAETAMLLIKLGSWNGINFDGGGSSALAMRFADNNVRVVNTPIHGGIPGIERAVAGCIGARISTASSGVDD
ncbi:MAG: phosphodiester glycosidase family protein [Treponema sp.]|nr:phosphodiester glycosidase family protein [Treponema sp.]